MILEMPKAKEHDVQVVVRLSKELRKRLDTYAERLQRDEPGPSWSRSDVVRRLLAHALDADEGRKR